MAGAAEDTTSTDITLQSGPAPGYAAGAGPTLGPRLSADMTTETVIAHLNEWGAARDQELIELRAGLGRTQAVTAEAFEQAKTTLFAIISDSQEAAEALRLSGQYEATQSVARLELVVAEARAAFGAQDLRFTAGLTEVARVVDTWAQAEPARVAAIVRATPPSDPGASDVSGRNPADVLPFAGTALVRSRTAAKDPAEGAGPLDRIRSWIPAWTWIRTQTCLRTWTWLRAWTWIYAAVHSRAYAAAAYAAAVCSRAYAAAVQQRLLGGIRDRARAADRPARNARRYAPLRHEHPGQRRQGRAARPEGNAHRRALLERD